jgi:hypothetical protein
VLATWGAVSHAWRVPVLLLGPMCSLLGPSSAGGSSLLLLLLLQPLLIILGPCLGV